MILAESEFATTEFDDFGCDVFALFIRGSVLGRFELIVVRTGAKEIGFLHID